jgi:dopamine receptor D1
MYSHFQFPFTYSERMNTQVVASTLICTWSFAFFTILIPVLFGHHPIARSKQGTDEHPVYEGECLAKFTPPYALTLSLLDFVLPCLVMCTLYAKLYKQAKVSADEIKAMRISLECNYVTSQQDRPKVASITKLRSEFKAAFTIALIMGTYLFCWLPFFFLQILSSIEVLDCCPDFYFKVRHFGLRP